MPKKGSAVVEIRPLLRLSDETMELLRVSAPKCADCASILKHLVDRNGIGPAWRADGTPYGTEDQKRHILEAKGLALSPARVEFLKARAGTCRKPDGSGCWYCARILDALTKEGMLREWPANQKDEQVRMSVDAQRAHIMLETGEIPVWEEAK